MFFAQRLGPDDFVNGEPQSFPMADLTGLIDDVRYNEPLNSVTLPGIWNFKHDGTFGYNNQGVITIGKRSNAMGPIYQPMQDNWGEDLCEQPLPQGGLNRTSTRLE